MSETIPHPSGQLPKLLTAREVSEQTTLPLATVYGLGREGAIPCVRLGRAMRFSAEAVATWLHSGGTIASRTPVKPMSDTRVSVLVPSREKVEHDSA